MSDNRATELLPCPFCGGEAKIHAGHRGDTHYYQVECSNEYGCGAWPAVRVCHTEAEAIEAWNTRAERTCELINAGEDCGNDIPSLMCFSCGYTAPDEVWCDAHYCPNCGAKVVGE